VTRCLPHRATVILATLMATAPAFADTPPSVLVRIEPVKTGTIQRIVTGYGTVGAGPGARTTLSLPYAGIVRHVDVVAGSAVHKGEPLMVIGTAPSTRAGFLQAEASLRAASQTLAHTQSLVAGHLATRTLLAQAEQAEVTAKSGLDALRLEGAGRLSATITAPNDGIVDSIAATPGTELAPGTPLATVLRADALVATVGLDAAEAGRIKPGDPVKIVPFSGGNGTSLIGSVRAVSAMVNPLSGLIDATIGITPSAIRAGEPIEAMITTGQVTGVIVPRDAALPDGKEFAIWQVKSGQAVKVAVTVSASFAGKAVVSGAIDRTLPIVISGNYQLTPGMAVRTDSEKSNTP
jgi:RND family efflux transporter MFP subunit